MIFLQHEVNQNHIQIAENKIKLSFMDVLLISHVYFKGQTYFHRN